MKKNIEQALPNVLELKFEGIDSWNRPVFKDRHNNRYGSVDVLMEYDAEAHEVEDNVTADDLLYFGSTFGCEPMGLPIREKIRLIFNN